MERSALAFRMFFLFFACFVTSFYEVSISERDYILQAIFFGVVKGGLIFLPLFLCEMVMRTFSLYLLRRLLFGIAVGLPDKSDEAVVYCLNRKSPSG